jgi:hypothetical protein
VVAAFRQRKAIIAIFSGKRAQRWPENAQTLRIKKSGRSRGRILF